METECSVGDDLPSVCDVENIKATTNEDNNGEPPKIFDNNAEIITVSAPIVELLVSDNPPEKAADVIIDEMNERDTVEQKKTIENIVEPMVVSVPIAASSINDNLPDIIGDLNDGKITGNVVNEPQIQFDNNAETMTASESIVLQSSNDNSPKITADVGNSHVVANVTHDQAKAVRNDIESMVVCAPIAKVADESFEVRKLEVQMTDALRGIAAAYSDSSDDEAEIRIVAEQIKIPDTIKITDYRCRDSDNEADSEEDSSSDSSKSDSSSESTNETDSDSNDEDIDSNKPKKRRERKRSEKGEYDKLPPIEDLNISVPEVLCNPVGKVGWMVEQMVVVTQLRETKALNPTLNIDTVLFIERGRRVLGRIFDVFGTVSDPHYCVRFNDAQHIKENNIEVGMTVYYCPNTPYTTLVFMADLLKMKASDDVGDDEHPAFSDDEEERAYYSSLKKKQVNSNVKGKEKNAEVPKKRSCIGGNNSGWKSKHPWNNERRTQQKQQQQHHRNPNNYNNIQQQNTWQYPPAQYNHWIPNPAFHNWPRPFSIESRSHYSSSSFQSNVDFPQQPRPTFMWPNNGTTFTPTQTQSSSWRAPAPPPPSFPPVQSPPPPPPGN